MKTYADALNFVLRWEGTTREDVPGDPGGKTFSGITQADYAAYRKEHGLPALDVFQATGEQIAAIYREHYAVPVHFEELPYNLAVVLFDTAVNCGLGRAVCWLQGVVGVTVDGAFGPKTLAATKYYIAQHSAALLASGVLLRRDSFYRKLGRPGTTLNKFLKGWLNRTAALRKEIA